MNKLLQYSTLFFVIFCSNASAKTVYDNCSKSKTNTEQVECLDNESVRLQKTLQEVYQSRLASLQKDNNTKTSAALVDSQEKWQIFGDSNCKVHSADNSRYGQIRALICHNAMAASRIDELQDMFRP